MTTMEWIETHKTSAKWRLDIAATIPETVLSSNGGPWQCFKLHSGTSASGNPFIMIRDQSRGPRLSRQRQSSPAAREFGAPV